MMKRAVTVLLMTMMLSAGARAEMKVSGADVKITGGEIRIINGDVRASGTEIKLIDAAAKPASTGKAAAETTLKSTDAALRTADPVKPTYAAPAPTPVPAAPAPATPSVKVSGFAQAQIVYDSSQRNKELYATLKRARVLVNGDLGNRIGLFAQAEFFTANINILDLVIDYNAGAFGKVGLGRFCVPFGLQNPISPYNLVTVNYSQIVSKTFGPAGRDYGLRWNGKYKMLEWIVAGINGSDNSMYANTATAVEDNNIKDIAGRVGFLPFKGFGIGASIYRGQSTALEAKRDRTGGDIRYDKGPIYFQGEYIAALDKATDSAGYYAEAGYKFGKFQPIARYEAYDGNTDTEDASEITIMAGGLNYYVSPNTKLTLIFEGKTDKAAPGLTDRYNDVWTFQTAVKF